VWEDPWRKLHLAGKIAPASRVWRLTRQSDRKEIRMTEQDPMLEEKEQGEEDVEAHKKRLGATDEGSSSEGESADFEAHKKKGLT